MESTSDNQAQSGEQTLYDRAGEEIERHILDTTSNKIAHFECAKHYSKLEKRVQFTSAAAFAGLVICWFIATQAFGFCRIVGYRVPVVWRMAFEQVIPLAFVVIGVFASTLLFLNRFGDAARDHRHAAQQYHRLFRKCRCWRTDCPNSTDALKLQTLAQSYREELSDLNEYSPDVEEWAWKRVPSELAKGGTKYPNSQSLK